MTQNSLMGTVARGVALGLALSGLVSPAAQAQRGESPPKAAEPAPARVAPAPWKSVEVGNFYFRRKNYRAALSRYEEAVGTDPYYAPGYLGLGRVYERIGLKQKALGAYRKYLDLLPSDKEAEEAKAVQRAIARLERGSGT